MRTIEICAGAGGQAIGLHMAGAEHVVLVENDRHACETLENNNRTHKLNWGEVICGDLEEFVEKQAESYRGQIDLVAGGVPCPPFSKAGKQLGGDDERDLFPAALKLVEIVRPTAVMLENVPGLLEPKFAAYRKELKARLLSLGYESEWAELQASDFGVSQLRPRAVLVALPKQYFPLFEWPEHSKEKPKSVGETLLDLMESKGWEGAANWASLANDVAPTIVGGSKKHGGPDLGPTRAKRKWHSMHVNGHRIGKNDEVPDKSFRGVLSKDGTIREGHENMPLLTLRMVARLQGFPDYWEFAGSKTHAYRQIGNAFPPPVAEAVGRQIKSVLSKINVDTDYFVEAAE
ncbi:DNA cytosine methyltransferase [Aestuariispira insulae]|uniref:Cytosine-specific methyltransferase n=1 Tax=Aestuariispira insulae TaxID=1461337 RepID=A0A3D9HVL8_9PROT|nr:DNA cytosine methyltransferase [Aestuariispira insulae]RED53480.1 DNA (cytosine-5)-methyltransferase 1 [Aestuariispira insulae]